MAKELSELASQRIIDSRDIIERLEELKDEHEALTDAIIDAESALESAKEALSDAQEEEEERTDLESLQDDVIDAESALDDAKKELADWEEDWKEELDELERINDECEGYGDWRHGESLIDENWFPSYVEEFASDIGAIGENSDWIVIDWEKTADNLKADYTEVEIQGSTYYFRA